MIESKREIETEEAEFNYPCLAESQIYIVLLTSSSRGTVVWCAKDTYHSVGDHFTGWLTQNFKPYNGTVTLQNKGT